MKIKLPKVYKSVTAYVSDLDRKYFEEHPEETQYIRDAYDDEFAGHTFAPGTKVQVTKLSPTLRTRQVLSDKSFFRRLGEFFTRRKRT